MLRRILVALSGTPYTKSAIVHAMEIAQRHQARVTGIAILDRDAARRGEPSPIGAGSERKSLVRYRIEQVQQRIDAAVAEFEDAAEQAGVQHQVLRDDGDPVEALCAAWRYQDLTLVGLRGFFEYGVLSQPKNALIHLITSGMRPILAVSKEFTPVRRVLVAYSGSLESAKAMKRFAQLRIWPDAEVELVNFVDGDATDGTDLLGDASTYWTDWGYDPTVRTETGRARDLLLRDARARKFDLVVLGDSARLLLTRRVFGDTSLHLIQNADCPLFLSH